MANLETGERSLQRLFGPRATAAIIVVVLLVIIPLWVILGASMTWRQQDRQIGTMERDVDLKFIEIAIGIIQNNPPTNKETLPMREWAGKVLQHFSARAAPDAAIALTDDEVKTLVGNPIAISGVASFSKTTPTGWVFTSAPISVIEGGLDSSGLPTAGSMVELADISLRTAADEDDEYGHGIIGELSRYCGYVVDGLKGEQGVYLLVKPESLSRCRRMKAIQP